jgi:hypothetical protein
MTPMRSLLFAATAGLALSACSTPPPSDAAPADAVAPAEASAAPGADVPPAADAADAADFADAADTADATDAEEMTMTCDAGKGQWAVGQLADEALVAKVKADTGSDRYRVIPPDTAVTMDYREDRVNIETDADNRVIAVRCG